jgi:COP9 signalosome complex subunit 5
MPVEVMGLMHGHPDLDDPGTLIVTDVFPLPVEGTETSVMTDNPEVTNYMISLAEALEHTRDENMMGWYHSHPFDVGIHSNAFLSGTDVSTQLSWQLTEDRAGNPWLALVVDPLRGVAKGRPEIGAFRCYPPEYTPPRGLAPDGVLWADERERNARWGDSCPSYYSLSVEYFMSSASSQLMAVLGREFLWARTLSAQPLPEESRERVPERLRRIADKVASFDTSLSTGSTKAFGPGLGAGAAALTGGKDSAGGRGASTLNPLAEAGAAAADLAVEHSRAANLQAVKQAVFNGDSRPLARATAHLAGSCCHAASALAAARAVLDATSRQGRVRGGAGGEAHTVHVRGGEAVAPGGGTPGGGR